MNSQQKAGELVNLLLEKERLEGQLGTLGKKVAAICSELNESMDDEALGSISFKYAGEEIKLSLVVKTGYALTHTEEGVKWDESARFFDWLQSVGEDGIIKTKRSIPWNSREKFFREWIEAGQELPEFVEETHFSTIKWNKSQIKRIVKSENT